MNQTKSPEVRITRTFDAPREFVFKAWSDAAHLGRWFAPNGCTVQFHRFDFRSGGTYHSCICTPDGYQCWCVGDYLEVVPPQRLVFTMVVGDERGNRVDPVSRGMDPAWPAETVVTVTFAEIDGKTQMTLHQTVSEELAKRTGAYPSWLQMFDRLDADLARTLNALWEKA